MMNISVVIPAYNAELYIEKSIDSLIIQTKAVREIIVVDDGSKDKTLSIINDLMIKDARIKVFQQQNSGASAARNRGIAEATGEWILFLDADDLCDKLLIESYENYLATHDVDAIYSQFIQIDEHDLKISDVIEGKALVEDEGFCQMFLRNPIIAPSGSLVKKASLLKLNAFDTSIRYVEDVDFWLRLLLAGGTIGYVEKPLSFIRRHRNNTTNTLATTNTGEQTLLNKYGLILIKEKLYSRNFPLYKNHLDYANFLIRYHQDLEALDVLNTININKSDEDYITYLFTKGIVHLNLEAFAIARQVFTEIILIDASHGAALNNLGVLCALEAKDHEAHTYFTKALKYFPGYLDATQNLQVLATKFGEYKTTKRELRKNLLRYS